MAEYLKHGPHGFCQRCERKYYLDELQEDGQARGLYVCDECFEEDHPQQYPVDTGQAEGVLHFALPPNNCEDHERVCVAAGQVSLFTMEPLPFVDIALNIGNYEVTT